MERYIDAADIMVNIKKHRDSLSYDELFDVEMEVNRMRLSDKTRKKLNDAPRASEVRAKRYGVKTKKV